MTYNVESYLLKSVEAYLELLPQGTRLKRVTTPFHPTSHWSRHLCPYESGSVARVSIQSWCFP